MSSSFTWPDDVPPPEAILFCCTMNAVRSPMAEGILKHLCGKNIYIDSAGVRECDPDGFMIAVMEEIGIDMRGHNNKTFLEMEDTYFDLIVALSPEAQHHALELTRTMACETWFWRIFDPSIVEGNREEKLAAYRKVRDQLFQYIENLIETCQLKRKNE